MTEYTLPRLPAQSDARQFSTLSAPLLFCHCLKEQQPTTSQPTTQQTLTGQRLEALTFVTLTGCRGRKGQRLQRPAFLLPCLL